MANLKVKTIFLPSAVGECPLDQMAASIVNELRKRKWNVPGLSVGFETYGTGKQKYKMVSSVQGNDFKLEFGRVEGVTPDKYVNKSAVLSVYIPKQGIRSTKLRGIPVYYLYVGKDWNKDKDWFMNSLKINAKKNNEPRRYLVYGKNSPIEDILTACTEESWGEYVPEGNEPVKINLLQKYAEFNSWLEEHVLKYILSFPEAEISEGDVLQLIPYKGCWERVYSLISKKCIDQVKEDTEASTPLAPRKRDVCFGLERSLVPLHAKNPGVFPETARKGFIWCDVNPNISMANSVQQLSPEVVKYMTIFSNPPKKKGKKPERLDAEFRYIVAIKLLYANDVYVIDNAKYSRAREAAFESVLPRKNLTQREVNAIFAARAATLIPINEYKGNYEQPLVLIQRELELEEIVEIAENPATNEQLFGVSKDYTNQESFLASLAKMPKDTWY